MNDFKQILSAVSEGDSLSQEQAAEAFTQIMSGEVEPTQIAAFLTALHVRGETIDEIAGGVSVLREKSTRVKAPGNAIDTCGTGGDASGTYNVSTAVALVIAACGVPVAKHGNRSLSSKSGSSEVLEQLGVKIDLSPEQVEACIKKANIGFMMAPVYHTAMKHVGPVRQSLGFRTIFNLMGPLSNPALPKRQLVGVFDAKWLEPFAEVLKKLGAEKAWIVHGADGLDELSTTGISQVAELKDGIIYTFEVSPEDVGLKRVQLSELVGGDPAHNAEALQEVVEGKQNAYRDIVLFNAGAALVVADAVPNLKDGVKVAAEAIDCGNVQATLHKLVEWSNKP